MPGRKPRTRLTLLATVLLCLFFGIMLTQSSAGTSARGQKLPDMFVAEPGTKDPFDSEKNADLTDSHLDTDPEITLTPSPIPTNTPVPTNTPIPEDTPVPDASLEASKGVWVSSGSNWMFLVDGVPYTGWLNDLDGKKYYFNKDGIMHTGWLDIGNKRYYMDMDGVMQTGDVVVGGKTYHLREDGSLKGYNPQKETSSTKEASVPTETPTPKEKKTIALTFDDGPSSFTDRILKCLEENNCKATFFMVGQEISNFPDSVKKMNELGMELGNHTYSHTDLTTLTREEVSSEIGKTDQLLLELTGQGASVVRPPFGSINETVKAEIGTPMILWSVDTLDWETQDTENIVQTVLENAGDGEIILLHDIFKETAEAAESFIPKLIEEGYELVTVHELAAAHNIELQTGIAYGSM